MNQQQPIPVFETTAPAVLDYANLRGQQPHGSRIVFEATQNGLKMTEPPAARAGVGEMVLGSIATALGLLFCCVAIAALLDRQSLHEALAMCLVFTAILGSLVGGGIGLFLQGKNAHTLETCVEIRDGKLWVMQPGVFPRRWRWEITPRLKMEITDKLPGFAGKHAGIFGRVCVRKNRLRINRVLFQSRPIAECDWIVRELTAAIDQQLQLQQTNE